MPTPWFFGEPRPRPLAELAGTIGVAVPHEAADRRIARPAPLEVAGPDDLSFISSGRFLPLLARTRAAAVLCPERLRPEVPAGSVALVTPDPHRAFARVIALFYPDAAKPPVVAGDTGVSAAAHVHASARIEAGTTVEPGAVIGAHAEIGAGSVIGPNVVIGPLVRIGRNGYVGAGSSILNALIGDRVMIHPGVRIGQDGFGYVMGPGGHAKVPQVGRVIIQDDVEIGANTTIDRGSLKDTVIGEGTKIDNLVQIAHNVSIGRHCVIVAQAGVSGSTVLEDYVVLAGKVGVGDHLHLGMGTQVAGASNVADDIPAGGRWVGTPARPVRRWMKELMALSALASGGSTSARDRSVKSGRSREEENR